MALNRRALRDFFVRKTPNRRDPTTMPTTGRLPPTDWPALLLKAPHFSAALMDALCEDGPSAFAPHVRAYYYFDVLDAQVSNGGVDQYFHNTLACLRNADEVPGHIAQNPVFAPALPLIEEMHAIWREVAPGFGTASDEDDDEDEDSNEALLAPHAARLEALAAAFFTLHHTIRQRLEADIVRDPHRYFAIDAVPGLRGQGVEHIVLDDGAQRLRFENGFPLGPNTFEREDGSCDVVWFSRDRTLVHAETSDFMGNRERRWIHFPSQASGSWRFDFAGDGCSVKSDGRSLSLTQHGLHEYFHEDGSLQSSALFWHGQELRRESFYADGTPQLRRRQRDDGEHWQRYWPGGAPNTECIQDREGSSRYLRCLDPEGRDLAPNGTGRLVEMLSLDDGIRQWREGELVGGFLSGVVVRMASQADGREARETERSFFTNGKAG